MNSRETILATLRRSLAAGGEEAARRQAAAARLAEPPAGVIPARGKLAAAALREKFRQMLEEVNATVEIVASPALVPAAVAGWLRRRNLPQTLRHGADPAIAGLPWADAPELKRSVGRALGEETTGLSRAVAGVAETGTLVLLSGPDNPSTIGFLPENHIVLVGAGDIVGDYETVWRKIRGAYGTGAMPRTVNLVTGPSRSADIEQTLLLGAHGPRALHVIITEE